MNKSKIKLTKIDILLGLLLIIIIFLIILLFSYAHFQVQTIENLTASTVQGDFECLDISFNEKGAINLNKNYPVTDNYALENFTPIEATVVNNCSTNKVDYVLSLSSIYLKSFNYDTSYIPDNKIRVKITKEVGASGANNLVNTDYLSNMSILDNSSNSYKYISNFYKTDSNYTNYNLKNTYKVDSSSIGANTTIKYKIYLWIDYYEGAPNRESNEENNNSTQGLKFSASSAITLNVKEPTLADKLIASGNLWQSKLEGDGYRYVGSGAVGESTNPNNFICFGTTSKSDCTSNQDKYLYRILGVFPDSNGKQHVKLIKYKQLGSYQWNDTRVDVDWEASTLYNGLNGEYFLTNSDFDYLQNNTWLNKISNWTWSAVNTQTWQSGPDYNNSVSPKEIYLHEMNRSTKTSSIGDWTTPLAKIGLMYASDYTLSLGSSALELTTGIVDNEDLLKTCWMNQSNNDTTKDTYEWTIARSGTYITRFIAWLVDSDGILFYNDFDFQSAVRPVFYLTSDTILSNGNGTFASPYILTE